MWRIQKPHILWLRPMTNLQCASAESFRPWTWPHKCFFHLRRFNLQIIFKDRNWCTRNMNAFPTSSIVVGKVTTLAHELRNHPGTGQKLRCVRGNCLRQLPTTLLSVWMDDEPVKGAAFISKASLTGAQLTEVLSSSGGHTNQPVHIYKEHNNHQFDKCIFCPYLGTTSLLSSIVILPSFWPSAAMSKYTRGRGAA